MEGKERKTRLPEYKKDFGNTEAEEMGIQFAEEMFNFVKRVEKASEYDDKVNHIDYIYFTKEGPFVAVQQKLTESEERIMDAIEVILKQPLVQLHDNQGKIISKEKLPLVLIRDKLEVWGEAYNRYLKERLDTPIAALKDKLGTKMKLLEQMLACLKTERYYFPLHQEILDPRIVVVESELSETKKQLAN